MTVVTLLGLLRGAKTASPGCVWVSRRHVRRRSTLCLAVLLTLALPGTALAGATFSTSVTGAKTVQRGATATYSVIVTNKGPDSIDASSEAIVSVRDVPSSGADLGRLRKSAGAGTWVCHSSHCHLDGGTLGDEAVTVFELPVKVLRSVTLDVDVDGASVFGGSRSFSIGTSGSIAPFLSALRTPPLVAQGSAPVVAFNLSERSRVTARAERIGNRWRIRRGHRLSIRCTPRKPRVRRGTRLRKGGRCITGSRLAASFDAAGGPTSLGYAALGRLKLGGLYRLSITLRTPDGRSSRAALSLPFRIVRG